MTRTAVLDRRRKPGHVVGILTHSIASLAKIQMDRRNKVGLHV